jgi:hypothetical protein
VEVRNFNMFVNERQLGNAYNIAVLILNRKRHLGDLGIDAIKMDHNPLVRAFEFSCPLCPAVVFLKTSKI